MEKNLSLPENNDLIPNDDPDLEALGNPMIPKDAKPDDPHFAQRITQQLETNDFVRIGEDLVLNRIWKHEGSGGEAFKLSGISGAEVTVELSQIVKAKNIEELRGLLEE